MSQFTNQQSNILELITLVGSIIVVFLGCATIIRHCIAWYRQSTSIRLTLLIQLLFFIIISYTIRLIGNFFGADHPHSKSEWECLMQSHLKGFGDWLTFLFVGLLDFIFVLILRPEHVQNKLLHWVLIDTHYRTNPEYKKYFCTFSICVIVIIVGGVVTFK